MIYWEQFEENERKRMQAEIVRQELKHKKQWEELKSVNMGNEKELEQIQVCIISITYTNYIIYIIVFLFLQVLYAWKFGFMWMEWVWMHNTIWLLVYML